MRRLLILVGLLAACTVPRDDYPNRVAQIWCDTYEACDLPGLRAAFGGRDACVASARGQYEDIAAYLDDLGCVYDPVAAGACSRQLDATSCDDFDDDPLSAACADISVWDCDGADTDAPDPDPADEADASDDTDASN